MKTELCCIRCGSTITSPWAELYCSRRCQNQHRAGYTDNGPDHIVDPETGCWVWQRKTHKGGYGPYRRYFFKANGFLPVRPLVIDHICGNRACVNPDHMRAVSHQLNTLRGDAPTAENFRKTHCPRGHEYSDDNTYVDPHGWRMCRTCERVKHRELRARPRRREYCKAKEAERRAAKRAVAT